MISGINHITISVNNIDEAFDFYKNLLKLKPIMKSKESCYFLAGEVWIALKYETIKNDRLLYSHIAFTCEKEFLDELRRKLLEKKIIEWQENKSEGDSIYILDPSGNKLELHCSDLNNRVIEGKQNWGPDVQWFI